MEINALDVARMCVEINELFAALKKYGRHLSPCATEGGADCTCGLSEALKETT